MVKLNFQHHYSSLQCHMILSYADFLFKKHFLFSVLKTFVLLIYVFVDKVKKTAII